MIPPEGAEHLALGEISGGEGQAAFGHDKRVGADEVVERVAEIASEVKHRWGVKLRGEAVEI